MATTKVKSTRGIQVMDRDALSRSERLLIRTEAGFADAELATRCMQATGLVPGFNTRLIN